MKREWKLLNMSSPDSSKRYYCEGEGRTYRYFSVVSAGRIYHISRQKHNDCDYSLYVQHQDEARVYYSKMEVNRHSITTSKECLKLVAIFIDLIEGGINDYHKQI